MFMAADDDFITGEHPITTGTSNFGNPNFPETKQNLNDSLNFDAGETIDKKEDGTTNINNYDIDLEWESQQALWGTFKQTTCKNY